MTDGYAGYRDEILDRGWIMVPKLLSDALVDRINTELTRAVAACGQLRTHRGVEAGNLGIAHHVLGMGGVFLEFMNQLPLQEQLENCLGGQIIVNSFGGFIHAPHASTYAGTIHRDIRSHFGKMPMMLNMLVMLDEFTNQNGATYLLSGSQKLPERPDEEIFFARAERGLGPAGSVLVFHSQLWHASGPNQSSRQRRALTLTFTRPFYKQQMDYPRLIGYDKLPELSENQRQLIGYNSRVPSSYDEWYQAPEDRMYKASQG